MTSYKQKVLMTATTVPVSSNDSCPRFVLDFAKALNRTDKFDCEILAPHQEGANFSDNLEGVNIKRYRYFWPTRFEIVSGQGIVSKIKKNKLLLLLMPFLLLAQFLILLFTLIKRKPDIIIAHWILPQGTIACFARLIRPSVKVISVAHGGDIGLSKKSWVAAKLTSYTIKRSDHVIAVSSALKDIMKTITLSSEKAHIIPMGVDDEFVEKCDELKAHDKTTKSLLFVGRLEEKKGVDILINAFHKLDPISNEIKLNIVGDGSQKESLVNLSNQLGVAERIIFHGAKIREDLPEIYKSASVVVIPSLTTNDDIEGLGIVILEAMIAGVPVVASETGGITDIIQHEENGLLVPQRDPAELANSIKTLLSDDKLSASLVKTARKTVDEHFRYNISAEKVVRLCQL